MKVIVIGGVAAGMSAASKISRIDKNAQITVYEKGGFLSYGACGLPYFVADYNDDYTKMIARTREQFTKMGISTYLYHEVAKVDPGTKTVTVRDLQTGNTFSDTYDKLMISTGAAAMRPPIPGMEKKGIYVLKTLEDGMALKEAASAYGIHHVVVIGGGYIGIETIEAMHALGKQVTCIEAAKRILSPAFDEEFSALATKELQSKGVRILTEQKAVAITGGSCVTGVQTDQELIDADLVVIAAGVRPATEFLADTGIERAANGAIVVDRQMRASLPDVWAAGDCALVYDCIKNRNVFLPLGTVANKCGRIAGTNICGGNEEYIGALSSAAIKVCDLEMGRTGMGEADAKEAGYETGTVVVNTASHPRYYPNPTPITIKVIYDKQSKRILGAQLAGQKGAALRTDVFAVAIHAGMTTKELGMSDLIYAPPFAGVWDAIHIACNAAK